MCDAASNRSSLRYREVAPPASIAEWVEAIWCIKGSVNGEDVHWHDVLPDGCADWIVSADDDGVESIFVGPMTRRLRVPMRGRANSFGIRFRPGALGGIVSVPLVELRDARADRVPLSVAPEAGAMLVDAVAGEMEMGGVVRMVERLLMRWHGGRGARNGAARAVRAVAEFAARNDGATIAQIAADAGMSVRTLRRVFDLSVGVGPKFFARVMRVQDVIGAMERARGRAGVPLNWADVAARSGFSDQAHLVREFREFTGWTPAAYFGAMKNGRFLQYEVAAAC